MNTIILDYTNKIKEINKSKRTQYYYILTMGCQLNENDSEKIAGICEDAGYIKTENIENANLVIFNTCCVRENAEDRLFGKLGEVKKQREEKGTIIAIGGCMMQEDHIIKKLKKSYPFVDIIFGTHTLENFAKDVYEVIENKSQVEDIVKEDGEIFEGTPISRSDKIKASVLIMYGCNNFCTYCIVPFVRGRERSRNPQDIIDEVQDLANQGCKEIMLLGQNVNSYLISEKEKGKNINFKVNVKILSKNSNKKITEEIEVNSFASLLSALDKIDGIENIRFISPHPKDFTDDVIDEIAKSKKICHLIHLPLQSGSTKILKKMNRNYSKEQYLDLAKKIKEKIPDVAFSTDIIVGFPGESEEDFDDTLDVVKGIKYEQVYMFIYSRRIGTLADKMNDQVPEDVKHERFDRLKELSDSQVEELNKRYIGTTQRILVEGTSKTNNNILTGRTYSNKVVNFEGSKELIGKMINVKIDSEHQWFLKGKI